MPKGAKGRDVDMMLTLTEALKRHRNLQERVLTGDDGRELTNKVVRTWFERAQRSARLEVTGAIHRLRHTFCSILAAEGAPAKAIQDLAGHASIATTMQYMHLSPSNRGAAIGLLDAAWTRPEGVHLAHTRIGSADAAVRLLTEPRCLARCLGGRVLGGRTNEQRTGNGRTAIRCPAGRASARRLAPED